MRKHLLQVYKTTGKLPDQLNLPKFPVELEYFIEWSRQLIRAEPISYTEIYHWAMLTNVHPQPWEIDVLVEIDSIFHKVKNEQS